jgi:hypothetical protein
MECVKVDLINDGRNNNARIDSCSRGFDRSTLTTHHIMTLRTHHFMAKESVSVRHVIYLAQHVLALVVTKRQAQIQ